MKLGGYSHTNGITFFCDVFKLKAIKKGGKNEYKLDWIIPPKWLRRLEKKPIIGGLSLIYLQWKVFDQKIKGFIGFMLALLLIDEFYPIPVVRDLLQNPLRYRPWGLGILLILLLLNLKKIVTLLRYHGAEHKVINCYCQHGMVNFPLVKEAQRYNRRCGTNLVVVFLSLYGVLYFLRIESILLTLGIFLVAVQIVKKMAMKGSTSWDWFFMKVQGLTVWEPRDEQIYLAMEAFNRLKQAYGLYQRELVQTSLKKSEIS